MLQTITFLIFLILYFCFQFANSLFILVYKSHQVKMKNQSYTVSSLKKKLCKIYMLILSCHANDITIFIRWLFNASIEAYPVSLLFLSISLFFFNQKSIPMKKKIKDKEMQKGGNCAKGPFACMGLNSSEFYKFYSYYSG